MKMIWHQAICNDLRIRQNQLSCHFQEGDIIFIRKKYLLPVVALIIDMVYIAGYEIHDRKLIKKG